MPHSFRRVSTTLTSDHLSFGLASFFTPVSTSTNPPPEAMRSISAWLAPDLSRGSRQTNHQIAAQMIPTRPVRMNTQCQVSTVGTDAKKGDSLSVMLREQLAL